mgnify:CR=1 FL=1
MLYWLELKPRTQHNILLSNGRHGCSDKVKSFKIIIILIIHSRLALSLNFTESDICICGCEWFRVEFAVFEQFCAVFCSHGCLTFTSKFTERLEAGFAVISWCHFVWNHTMEKVVLNIFMNSSIANVCNFVSAVCCNYQLCSKINFFSFQTYLFVCMVSCFA